MAPVTPNAQHATDEGGLSGAEVTHQRYRARRLHVCREVLRERQRCGLVGRNSGLSTISDMSESRPASATTEQRIVQLWPELGWAAVGIADIALEREAEGYQAWIAAGHHGEMSIWPATAAFDVMNCSPAHTIGDLCCPIDYWPSVADAEATLQSADRRLRVALCPRARLSLVLRNKLRRLPSASASRSLRTTFGCSPTRRR